MAIALLNDMMHNKVEVYVDDMIVKSKDRECHIINFEKILQKDQGVQVEVEPPEMFGVTAKKLLSFLVNDRGIEVYPSKIKAILEMPPVKDLESCL